ncbi:hypothetical protein [uncultured Polaribacter sp.]|uniref:hypothetical protein n=1 Tax=uncultured Polaribacter sp. TaxID=174711 RepID=UPI00261140D2|nr:hypothetical protein [uncultured Polaribacter sp.]
MKKILIKLYLLSLTIILFSCSNEDAVDNSKILTKVVDVEFKLNGEYKSKVNTTLVGQIEFTMNDEEEDYLDFTFSDNILKQLPITEKEFYQKIEDNITLNIDGSYKSKSGKFLSDISDCKDKCQEDFTNEDGSKIKGRGWCKAGCYVDEVIRVAVILVPIILAAQ